MAENFRDGVERLTAEALASDARIAALVQKSRTSTELENTPR